MSTNRALIPVTSSNHAAIRPNGNGASSSSAKAASSVPPLSDEMVNDILKGRGLRGWLRVARVSRVLGLFTLYIFLDTYHIRSSFNRKIAERRSVEAVADRQIGRASCRERV